MPDPSLADQLDDLADAEIRGLLDARRAAALILRYAESPEAHEDPSRPWRTTFHSVLAALQSAADEHAVNELRREALPAVSRLFDLRFEKRRREPAGEGYDPSTSELLFALKVLAMYGGAGERVVRAVRAGFAPDDYMWSMIFGALARDVEEAAAVLAAVSRPLPTGFVAVAILDAANGLALRSALPSHPFDCAEGHDRLRAYVSDASPENASYAHSATAAIPFLADREVRAELLEHAEQHADDGVRLEAAWARAKLGDDAGIEALRRLASDARSSSAALRYLDELGRSDAIPPEATDPTFRAMAECIEWLAHPNEMGRPPDSIELYDHRVAAWPPTNDVRPLWLFRYVYGGETPAAGLAMVGSVTFGLFGEATAELSAEDAYAFHCCWELEIAGDPRAPEQRSVRAGKKILGWSRKGPFGWLTKK